ncbi:MAG: PIN domain-containing protein [Desulfomonile tiedjei]|nr:PIN domain-containing protein [Desulfomonile tiedjei]
MKVLLDTSLLVAAMVEAHPVHENALPWLQRVKDGTDEGFVAAHSIAELYSILTTLPVRPRISSVVARRLIDQNVITSCNVVALSEEDYVTVLIHLSELGIVGGGIYDALIMYAGIKSGVDRFITLNEKDFRKVYPQFADRLAGPLDG